MKRFLCILFVTLLSLSCERALDWENESTDTLPDFIVEGIFTNEKKHHQVKLSLPMRNLNETPEPASGAMVYLSDGSNYVLLAEVDTLPGTYQTVNEVRGVTGKRYYLYIEWQEKNYLATDSMVPVSNENPLQIVPTDSANFYRLEFNEQGNPAMVEAVIDWTHLSESCITNACRFRQLFYVLYTVDVNEAFKWDTEQLIFPMGSQVIRKKYSLSPGHQKFIRSLLMETDWRGGIFDVLPGNVHSNISNGAAGFFGACTVISDTIIAGN